MGRIARQDDCSRVVKRILITKGNLEFKLLTSRLMAGEALAEVHAATSIRRRNSSKLAGSEQERMVRPVVEA